MKKLLLLFVLTFFVLSCNNESVMEQEQACDNGTFVGDLILRTQQEVNDFGELCYTKIDGQLKIGSPLSTEPSDVTDLTPLSSLTEVYSSSNSGYGLWINHAPNLTNLDGLENLVKVNKLIVSNCSALINLNGLNNLSEIGAQDYFSALLIFKNSSLQSLDGLESLQQLGSEDSNRPAEISIQGNLDLSNLDALSNLQNVYGDVFIGDHSEPDVSYEGNVSLIDYCGLTNLFVFGNFNEIKINNNAFNPTVEDIIAGNCSQ